MKPEHILLILRWVHVSDVTREQFLLRAARILAHTPAMPFALRIDDIALLDELKLVDSDLYASIMTAIRAGHIGVGRWYTPPHMPLVSQAMLAHNRRFAARIATPIHPDPSITVTVLDDDTVDTVSNRLAATGFDGTLGFAFDSIHALEVIREVAAADIGNEGNSAAEGAHDIGARPRIYQAYKRCETLIMHALPLFEALVQAEQPISGFLRQRLLPYSAEAYIIGTVSDMLAKAAEINLTGLVHTAQQALENVTEEGTTLAIINPNSVERTDIVNVEIDYPVESWPRVWDDAGNEIPISVVYYDAVTRRGTIQLLAKDVPPWGVRLYTYDTIQATDPPNFDDKPTLENAFLSLSLDPHTGSVTLFDKRNGNLFESLNHYQDGGDCGTILDYEPPQSDTVIAMPTNSPLPYRRLLTGQAQTLEVLHIYRVPETLTEDGSARLALTAQFVPISVTTFYTLHTDLPRLDIETVIETNAKNHRFSSLFPLSVSLNAIWADGTRINAPYEDGLVLQARRSLTFDIGETAVSILMGTNQSGILREQHGRWAFDLTLLRGVDWSTGFATPEAQNTGQFTFNTSVVFHDEQAENAAQGIWQARRPLIGVARPSHEEFKYRSLMCGCDNIDIWSVEPNPDEIGIVVHGALVEGGEGIMTMNFDVAWAKFIDAEDLPIEPLTIREGRQIILEGEAGEHLAIVVKAAN